MPKYFFFFLRVLIYIFPVTVFFWTASRYFAFSGIQDFTYDFSKESAFVSQLWPSEHRSEIYQNGNDRVQDMEKDPVSFSVQLTRTNFKSIDLYLTYKKRDDIPLQIGLQKGDGSWNFFFKDLKSEDTQILGEWKRTRIRYDISNEYVSKKNRLNFLLVSSNLGEKNNPISFTEIHVRLERDPMTIKHFFERTGIFL